MKELEKSKKKKGKNRTNKKLKINKIHAVRKRKKVNTKTEI